MKGKYKFEESKERNRDIKCRKCQGLGHVTRDCPNKRTMINIQDGEVVTEGEESENEKGKEEIVEVARRG